MKRGPKKRSDEVPADFHMFAPVETSVQLQDRYHRSFKMITAWRQATGLYRPRIVAAKTYKPVQWRGPKAAPLGQRDVSLFGRAADHLRRDCPVFRCDAEGHFDLKGAHYRVGSRPVMTADEMLALAERKGFVAYPDALCAEHRIPVAADVGRMAA